MDITEAAPAANPGRYRTNFRIADKGKGRDTA